MIYLKEFPTAQDYEAVKNNLPTPNVSLIAADGEVKYKKSTEPGPTPPTPSAPTLTFTYNLDKTTNLVFGYYFSVEQVETVKLDGVTTTLNVTTLENVQAGNHTVEFTLKTDDLLSDACASNELISANLQGISTIGDGEADNYGAFMECNYLTTVVLGSEITHIGTATFQYCSGLTSITINAATPPTLGSSVFDGSTCPIYVPADSVDTYKAASGWSDYTSRIQAIP